MRCQSCGYINADGEKRCINCGNNMIEQTWGYKENICPICGSKLNFDAAFCGECGNPINKPQFENNIRNSGSAKKNDNVFIVLTISLVAVIFAFAIAIGYVYHQKNSVKRYIPSVEYNVDNTKRYDYNSTEDNNVNYIPEVKAVEKPSEPITEKPSEIPSERPIDGYLFPSDREYISGSYLYGISKEEVALIRNEIYARHGYIFNTEPYKSYFESKDWYVPNVSFTEDLFNSIEKANKDFIVSYEEFMGWR